MKLLNEISALSELKYLIDNATHAKLAVAFWGHGAIKRLGLDRPGLTLEVLCNLDSGACNPSELREMMAIPGLTLRSHPSLHAKIYWTAKGAVIGSSNASANGLALEGAVASGWHEANVSILDPALLGEIDTLFRELFENGYVVEAGDLERAESLWASRNRMIPTGQKLAASLFEAYERAPDRAVWKKTKVAYWAEDLSEDSVAWLDEKVSGGSFSKNASAYEGWNDRIAPGDYVIDYKLGGSSPKYGEIWRATEGDAEGRDLRVVQKIRKIAVPGVGNFTLNASEKAILAQFGSRQASRTGTASGAVFEFSEVMKAVKDQGTQPSPEEFEKALRRNYSASVKIGYQSPVFEKMVSDLGGVGAAKQLIVHRTTGFTRLWELKRLNLTVEALVVDPKWRALFSEKEVSNSMKRLKELGYSYD